MNETMIKIILDEITLEFDSEQLFCKNYLHYSYDKWNQWKQGKAALPNEVMTKIKGLFSDYEWMLMQKVAEQSLFFPEKRNYAVQEFRRLKTLIAKKWIELPISYVELVTKTAVNSSKEIINLRVILKYGEWGYDDILNFPMPSYVSKQIDNSTKGLLEWVDHELTEVYVEQNKETTVKK